MGKGVIDGSHADMIPAIQPSLRTLASCKKIYSPLAASKAERMEGILQGTVYTCSSC